VATVLLFAAKDLPANPGELLWTVPNPDPGLADYFGESVAVLGSTVLIGASRDDSPGTNDDSGAAYLFSGATGDMVRAFPNPEPDAYDGFGAAVGGDGDAVLVGAPYDDGDGYDRGTAYLIDGTTGAVLHTLQSPSPTNSGHFGYALAVGGGTVLVGAPRDGAQDPDDTAGAVHLFDRASGELILTIPNPEPEAYDQFGQSVAASENRVLVGAPYDDGGGIDRGAVYLFEITSGLLLHTFRSPNPTDFGQFGQSVAAAGDVILIGGPHDNTPGTTDGAGAAYLFSATTGDLLLTLGNPTPGYYEQFGRSVAVANGAVLIGAPYDNTPGTSDNAGAAHLFDGTTGDLLETLTNPAPAFHDAFGQSVSVLGGLTAVGAFRDNSGAPKAGSAYLFQGVYNGGPPDCAGAYPGVAELWPPNRRMVAVEILGVTDPDGDPVAIEITRITQDEPVGHEPDGAGVGTPIARVRAERDGRGNGRVYELSFVAVDATGQSSEGRVVVRVLHDRRSKGGDPVDDGQLYDSMVVSLHKPAASADPSGTGLVSYPNPFNPATTILYTLSRPGDVSLVVHNLLGQSVRVLARSYHYAGVYRVTWDGTDDGGRPVSSGTYVCRLITAEGTHNQHLLLLK
jgi:hypothetical protein